MLTCIQTAHQQTNTHERFADGQKNSYIHKSTRMQSTQKLKVRTSDLRQLRSDLDIGDH